MESTTLLFVGCSLAVGFVYGYCCAIKQYSNSKYAKIISSMNGDFTIFEFENGHQVSVPSMILPMGSFVTVEDGDIHYNCPNVQHPICHDKILIFPPNHLQVDEVFYNKRFNCTLHNGTQIGGVVAKPWINTIRMYKMCSRESTIPSRKNYLPTE